MKKSPALACFLALFCAGAIAADNCDAIFEARKNEILLEIDRMDRDKAELDALKDATARVIFEKEEALKKREADIELKLKAIEAERAKIEDTLNANKQILSQIAERKDSKLTSLYSGMKANSAGEIMNALDPYLAAEILSQLDPKTAAGVIARIEPAAAANITAILHKGPPYDGNNQGGGNDQNASQNQPRN